MNTLGVNYQLARPTPMDYSPFAFLAFFIAMWLVVTALLSVLSGWFSLADTFRKDDAPSGEKFNSVSGATGPSVFPVNYYHCLNVVVTTNGLHIRIFFLFRILSPPLLILWAAVEEVTSKRLFFFFPYVKIKIRNKWQCISIYGKASNAILAAYSNSTGSNKR